MGVFDFGQGVSRGFWAGGLGAPVDTANLFMNALRAGYGVLGKETGMLRADQLPVLEDKPIGGSEWIAEKMRQAQLLKDAPGTTADTYGNLVGNLIGPVTSVFAPQIGYGLLRAGENAAIPRTMNPQTGAVDVGEYGIPHRPMTEAGGAARLDDLTPAFGEDIYGKNALQFFGSGGSYPPSHPIAKAERAILKTLQSVRGKPDEMLTIYRGVPKGSGNSINPGDWVTLDPRYAAEYGDVVSMKVPASSLTGWADSLLEFGYHPK